MPVSGSLVTQCDQVKYGPLSNPGVDIGIGNEANPAPSLRMFSPSRITSCTGPLSTTTGAIGLASARSHLANISRSSRQPRPTAYIRRDDANTPNAKG